MTDDDTPKFLARDPTAKLHALTLEDPIHPAQTVTLPLALRAVTLLLNVRALTLDEWNSDTYRRLHLTSETLTWDPTTTLYEDQELAMTDYSGNLVRRDALRGQVSSLVINSLSSLTADLLMSLTTTISTGTCPQWSRS